MRKESAHKKEYAKAGTSMVEVLVAFLVVMLMMAMFTKVVSVSVGFLQRSRKTIEASESFDEKYYRTDERQNRKKIAEELVLSVDTKKTSSNNNPKAASLGLEKGSLLKYEDGDTNIVRYSIGIENAEDSENPEDKE